MQSYGAARGLFNFVSFISNCAIIGGGVLIVGAVFLAAEMNLFPSALMNFLVVSIPGLALLVVGVFTLVYVQTSRASVDSAEYAQQALKVARDQLEISKQMLLKASAVPTSATYTAPNEGALEAINFDTAPPEEKAPESPQAAQQSPTLSAANGMHEYSGNTIEERDGQFLLEDKSYPSLIDAKLAIDGQRIRSKLSGLPLD